MPPTTLITSVVRGGILLHVRGSVADSSDIKYVMVNGQRARSTCGSFAEWEITLEVSNSRLELSAFAEDVGGLVERSPHKVLVD